jgi:hypothetical protein
MTQQRDGDPEPESDSERRTTNTVMALFFVAIVGAGIWLVNALVDHRKLDNCIAQGRRNCAPIEVPNR